jgi:uncharacterized membrane protein
MIRLLSIPGRKKMRRFLTNLWSTGIVGTFLAGLLALLPITLTVIAISWLVRQLSRMFGPGSTLGGLMTYGGDTIVGEKHQTLAFLVGLVIALGLVWLVGLLVKTQAKEHLDEALDWLMGRLPLVRSIYKPVAQVVRLMASGEGKNFQGMSVVACRLGGGEGGGVELLGLVTSPKIFDIAGEKRRLVYLPTSPLPMSGGLLLVPESSIIPMPDMSIDELMQIHVSLGVVTPEGLSVRK